MTAILLLAMLLLAGLVVIGALGTVLSLTLVALYAAHNTASGRPWYEGER